VWGDSSNTHSVCGDSGHRSYICTVLFDTPAVSCAARDGERESSGSTPRILSEKHGTDRDADKRIRSAPNLLFPGEYSFREIIPGFPGGSHRASYRDAGYPTMSLMYD